MSCLWLVEAKAYPDDTRASDATTSKFWLRPGSYTLGRPGSSCDVVVTSDKSISRVHANIIVPDLREVAQQGEVPFVGIVDCSRYGTLVTRQNDLAADGAVGATQRAYDRWLVRFGYQSPFK